MKTRATILKHPIHPILVALPIGMWLFALASDLIYSSDIGGPIWKEVAFYNIAGGLVGALLAAVPGFVDLLTLTERRVRRIGVWHMAINLTAVVLFAINLIVRLANPEALTIPLSLSIVGVSLILISGWLGGEMVHVHGITVENAKAETLPGTGKAEPQLGPKRAA